MDPWRPISCKNILCIWGLSNTWATFDAQFMDIEVELKKKVSYKKKRVNHLICCILINSSDLFYNFFIWRFIILLFLYLFIHQQQELIDNGSFEEFGVSVSWWWPFGGSVGKWSVGRWSVVLIKPCLTWRFHLDYFLMLI